MAKYIAISAEKVKVKLKKEKKNSEYSKCVDRIEGSQTLDLLYPAGLKYISIFFSKKLFDILSKPPKSNKYRIYKTFILCLSQKNCHSLIKKISIVL